MSNENIGMDDPLSVGVEWINQEHSVLFQLRQQAVDAVAGGDAEGVLQNVLMILREYADMHLRHEEAMLEAVCFPGCVGHAKTHDRFRDRIDEIARQAEADPDGFDWAGLFAFIDDWLVSHIMGEDQVYARFLKVKGIEPPPPSIEDDLLDDDDVFADILYGAK